MKILIEMRPAFDGYSGIPQETRLLFQGLTRLDDIEVVGLIQSGNLVIDAGLPMRAGRKLASMGTPERIDRLSKVVVSLQQGPAAHRFEHLRKKLLKITGPLAASAGALVGRQVALTGFEPLHFKDFVWRSMFAKSLPVEDFDVVTAGDFRVLRWPWSIVNAIGVVSGALGHAMYPRLDTQGLDVMIAETPYPGRVRAGTRLVVRYHDAIPLLMPHTIKDRGYHRALHYHALRRNAADGAWFACVSESTRRDLLSVLPGIEARTVTIPNMIARQFHPESAPATRVPEIVWSRKNRHAPHEGGAAVAPGDFDQGTLPYLLMVSTLEPRKNHLALLDAWELLRAEKYPGLNLVCVGGLGWEHESIMRRFSPWLQRGGVHLLHDVPASDLRLLYRHARATVCPSLGEGFDFSGIEAMRCGGVVAASDIPVHREIYGAAAEYFSAYSPREIADTVDALIASTAQSRRGELVSEGARVAEQYLPERVLPQWHDFLRSMHA